MGKNHLVNFVDSIIPIVTKCRPESTIKDYDLDLIRDDIEDIAANELKLDDS